MNRTGNPVARGIVCAAIIVGWANGAGRNPFSGGMGKPEDPYRIATAEQLILLGSPDGGSGKMHYVLAASIDLSVRVCSSPVIPQLSGSLDGNGHTIRGLTSRGPGSQGLFGRIDEGARVTNLQLEDVSLAGTGNVGGLAAVNAGSVSNCHVAGRVLGTGRDTDSIPGTSADSGDVGGLVGVNVRTITDSSSTAWVSGIKYVGGLVGANRGTVTGSSSGADVSGNDGVGGLAGCNSGGVLRNCAGTSLVSGSYCIGGLVGVNEGSISASYSDSDVIGERDLGGLVGSNGSTISVCYSAGSITGRGNAGGLVGTNDGSLFSCYSVSTITVDPAPGMRYVGGLVGDWAVVCRNGYFLAPADGGGPDNKIGMPLTAAQMKQRSNFPNWDFWGAALDGNDDSWFMPPDGFPVLSWQTEVTGLQPIPDVRCLPLDQARAMLTTAGFVPRSLSYDFHRTLAVDCVIFAYPGSTAPAGAAIDLGLSSGRTYDWTDNAGNGSVESPYQIETAGQLESLIDHVEHRDKHFVLTADIEMGGRTYPAAVISWNKTGPRPPPALPIPFDGTFDGRGHTIRNLSIMGDGSSGYLGLFGVVSQSGRVSDLHLLNAQVTSQRTVGGYGGFLAATNHGTLINCSVVGGMVNNTSWGGLVGGNYGDIIDCYVDGVLVVGPTVGR